MIKKARVENALYDVISYEEFVKNRKIYSKFSNNIAIEENGFILPIRTPTDTRPGFYFGNSSSDNEGPTDTFKFPSTEEEASIYSNANVINFSDAHNFRGVIEAQDKLNKAERSILTTVDNITVPEIYETDTPFMKAIKEAIIQKHVDLDSYSHRFGNNYPNDKRLLKKEDITLQKGIAYANCLDFDIYAIIKDKNSDVANPIGEPIVVKLTGDNSGFTDEYNSQLDQITSCGNQPVNMNLDNAAFPQSMYPQTYMGYIPYYNGGYQPTYPIYPYHYNYPYSPFIPNNG
jgi:hypothetical protein